HGVVEQSRLAGIDQPCDELPDLAATCFARACHAGRCDPNGPLVVEIEALSDEEGHRHRVAVERGLELPVELDRVSATGPIDGRPPLVNGPERAPRSDVALEPLLADTVRCRLFERLSPEAVFELGPRFEQGRGRNDGETVAQLFGQLRPTVVER